jgi:hypothetical protein
VPYRQTVTYPARREVARSHRRAWPVVLVVAMVAVAAFLLVRGCAGPLVPSSTKAASDIVRTTGTL